MRHLLGSRNLLLRSGTLVDAALIATPPLAENREGKRYLMVTQTTEGATWARATNVHLGTDN